jgi:hypothetical protein
VYSQENKKGMKDFNYLFGVQLESLFRIVNGQSSPRRVFGGNLIKEKIGFGIEPQIYKV